MIEQIVADLKQQYPELPEELIMDALQRMSQIDPEGQEVMADGGAEMNPSQVLDGSGRQPAMDEGMDPNWEMTEEPGMSDPGIADPSLKEEEIEDPMDKLFKA